MERKRAPSKKKIFKKFFTKKIPLEIIQERKKRKVSGFLYFFGKFCVFQIRTTVSRSGYCILDTRNRKMRNFSRFF